MSLSVFVNGLAHHRLGEWVGNEAAVLGRRQDVGFESAADMLMLEMLSRDPGVVAIITSNSFRNGLEKVRLEQGLVK